MKNPIRALLALLALALLYLVAQSIRLKWLVAPINMREEEV